MDKTTDLRDDWLSPAECARVLKLSETTVYSLLATGRMPGRIRVGRQWRINREALVTAVAGSKP